jgi:hypothetical protein
VVGGDQQQLMGQHADSLTGAQSPAPAAARFCAGFGKSATFFARSCWRGNYNKFSFRTR